MLPLAPSGKWTVASHEASCSLSRSFGEGRQTTDLVLSEDGSGAGLIDVALEPSAAAVKTGRGSIALLPNGPTFSADYLGSGSFSVAHRLSFIMRLGADDMARLSTAAAASTVTGVAIQAMDRQITLASGSLRGAMATLAKCRNLLLTSWDVDPAKVIPAPPVRRSWLGQDEKFGTTGRALVAPPVTVVLSVREDGTPDGCRTVRPGRDARSDRSACNALVAHARFPAAPPGSRERDSVLTLFLLP